MKNFIIIYFYLFSAVLSAQQNYDANWLFCYENGFGTKINFQKDSFIVSDYKDKYSLDRSGITMSDKNGNLIFYTNGCAIYDRTGCEM